VTGSEAPHRLPTAAKVNLAALAILAAALVVHLWPEWSHDADLSHGFLAPVACGLLVYLCLHPGARGTLPGRAAAILTGSFGAAALAGLWTAGLFAVTLDWTSPLVDFTLACSFALLGFGAIAAFADRRVALVPFSWACLAAAALWPLCSPIPPGTYSRLTSALQLWVSGSVMRARDGRHRGGVQRRAQPDIVRVRGRPFLGGADPEAMGAGPDHRRFRAACARDELRPLADADPPRQRGRPYRGRVA
jgi:hypothetical protein